MSIDSKCLWAYLSVLDGCFSSVCPQKTQTAADPLVFFPTFLMEMDSQMMNQLVLISKTPTSAIT